MALRERIVPISLVSGIDTGKDPKQTDQALHVLVDGVFDKEGSISSRVGFEDVIDTLEAGTRLTTLSGRPVSISSTEVSTHSGLTTDSWGTTTPSDGLGVNLSNRHRTFEVEERGVWGESTGRCEMAALGSVLAVVDNKTLRTFSRMTGEQIDELECTKWVPDGTRLIVAKDRLYCFSDEDQNLVYHEINTTTGRIEHANSWAAGISSLPVSVFDVVDLSTDDERRVGLVAETFETDNTPVLWVAILVIDDDGTSTGTEHTSSAYATDEMLAPLTAIRLGDDLLAVWTVRDIAPTAAWSFKLALHSGADASTILAAEVSLTGSPALGALAATLPMSVVGIETSATTVAVFYSSTNLEPATGGAENVYRNRGLRRFEYYVSAGPTGGTRYHASYAPQIGIASKPFLDSDGKILFWAFVEPRRGIWSEAQSIPTLRPQTMLLVREYSFSTFHQLMICGKALTDSSGIFFGGFYWSDASILLGYLILSDPTKYGTRAYYPHPVSVFEDATEGSDFIATSGYLVGARRAIGVRTHSATAIRLSDAHSECKLHPVDAGDGHLVLPGACPSVYDGSSVVELGFVDQPIPFDHTVTTAAGGPGAGQYGFVGVYEWIDAKGALHRSPPSNIYTVTIASTEKFETFVFSAPFTRRDSSLLIEFIAPGAVQRSDVRLALYRTVTNGSVYYRCKESYYNESNTGWPYEIILEDENGDLNQSNASLEENEQLYTTGAADQELPDEQPPPFVAHTMHQGRHFIVPVASSGLRIQYSKPVTQGLAIAHSSAFVIEVNPDGGEITALRSYQEKLLIFRERSIMATHGFGLNLDGSGSGYADPYYIARGVGCSNPASIAEVPQGLIFQSPQGMHMLGRDMSVTPVGARVDYQTQDAAIDITATATIIPQEYVVFLARTGNSLVFHYATSQWGEFSINGTGACEAFNQLFVAEGDGTEIVVSRDTPAYSDEHDTTKPTLDIVTGWFSLAGLGGFHRFRKGVLIGQMLDGDTIRIQIGYDFDPVWVDTLEHDTSDASSIVQATTYAQHWTAAGLDSSYLDGAMTLEFAGSRQKCTAVRFRITHIKAASSEQGFRINALALVVAGKPGAVRIGAGRQMEQ